MGPVKIVDVSKEVVEIIKDRYWSTLDGSPELQVESWSEAIGTGLTLGFIWKRHQ